MMHRLGNVPFIIALIALGLGDADLAHAQTRSSTRNDAAGVRAAAKEYLGAVQRGDQGALKRLWTPTGDYVDATGQLFKAEELIGQLTAESSPKNSTTANDASETKLRFVTPDVAIEDGVAAGSTNDSGGVMGRFTAVWVRRDGKWLLDSLREAAVATAPAVNEHLAPLGFLLGEWTGKMDEGDILVSANWSDAGNYLLREFVIRSRSGEKIGGTQRIGWDPVTNQIKSWSFDSQGGLGKDIWRRDGNRWIVESSDVMANGKTATSSASYTPTSEGRFLWESAGGNVAGAKVKPVRVEFTRAADDE